MLTAPAADGEPAIAAMILTVSAVGRDLAGFLNCWGMVMRRGHFFGCTAPRSALIAGVRDCRR